MLLFLLRRWTIYLTAIASIVLAFWTNMAVASSFQGTNRSLELNTKPPVTQKSDDDKDDDYMGPPRGDCPILIVPCPTSEQGAIEMSIDLPFFEWEPVEGATEYTVSIHSSEDPSQIVWPENGEPLSIVDTKLVYPSSLPPGEYLFVVEAGGVDRPPDEGRFVVDGQ